jgi:Integral membrane protein S linking to the trans Golgi network
MGGPRVEWDALHNLLQVLVLQSSLLAISSVFLLAALGLDASLLLHVLPSLSEQPALLPRIDNTAAAVNASSLATARVLSAPIYDVSIDHVLFGLPVAASLWPLAAHSFSSALCGPFLLLRIVGQSRRVFDFSLSSQLIHVAMVSGYAAATGADVLETLSQWRLWLALAVGCASMTVVGRALCVRRELDVVPVGSFARFAQGGGNGNLEG